MEKEAFKQFKDILTSKYSFRYYCKTYDIDCGDITKKITSRKINSFIKEHQEKIKERIQDLLGDKKMKYGFCFERNKIYINITNKKTYVIIDKHLYDYENDMNYFFADIFIFFNKILNDITFYKKVNKLTKGNHSVMKLQDFDKISQIINFSKTEENKSIMIQKYNILEDYFENTKFPNQLQNNVLNFFVHDINPMFLEILLKSKNPSLINPVSNNTYGSQRGIYTTLKTDRCEVERFEDSFPMLIFSKELVNDFGYIFNFSFQYGMINKKSLIKGQKFKIKDKEYSAIEKGILSLCKKKEREHEVVFYTDHIKLKDYLEAIVFRDEEEYKIFKNMKDIKYKKKMKFISQ